MSRLWFACSEPERPTDPDVIWHYRVDGEVCRGCAVKAAALGMAHPDDSHVAWLIGMTAEVEP